MSAITFNSGRATAQEANPSRLKLTRRGRFLLFGLPLMLLAVAALVLLGFATTSAHAGVGSVGTGTAQVTVQAGDSIWSIAAANAADRDPREVVAEIVELNNLDSSVLLPGQQIFVPTR
ncbi:LysM peptidoglycan-binding domain-containing protein [Psychromicrobium sp. YIM B11713]|uniref:LysM peptidoglycan-binding domain-containing protein n=1 Tax=Psychromicrobium sp. YIM B11713 TaxID=3145233 RepID=UPI00374E88A6